MASEFSIKLSGPLFEGNPTEAVQAAFKNGLSLVALKGQAMWQTQVTPGHGVKTGNYRRSIVGKVISWNEATIGSPVIYASWLEEGAHGRQKSGKFSGYGFAKDTTDQLNKMDVSAMIGDAIAKKLNG